MDDKELRQLSKKLERIDRLLDSLTKVIQSNTQLITPIWGMEELKLYLNKKKIGPVLIEKYQGFKIGGKGPWRFHSWLVKIISERECKDQNNSKNFYELKREAFG